jgi:hypothetical protein
MTSTNTPTALDQVTLNRADVDAHGKARSSPRGLGINLRLDEVVMDCGDPCRLATFWSEALDYELTECDEDIAAIEDPTGSGPSVLFQRVPEKKSAKNRVHLDLSIGSGDLELVVDHLLSMGATRVDTEDPKTRWWVVLADPEGNEFCVVS